MEVDTPRTPRAVPPTMSKNYTFKRGMNEMNSEFPLTQIEQGVWSTYEVSLNDQSQEGRSQGVMYHRPMRVVGDIKRLS